MNNHKTSTVVAMGAMDEYVLLGLSLILIKNKLCYLKLFVIYVQIHGDTKVAVHKLDWKLKKEGSVAESQDHRLR